MARQFITDIELAAQRELRFEDADSSAYVGFKAPAAVTTNRIWTLPATDGTSSQVLSTNGSGVLSWATAGGGGGLTHFAESESTASPNATVPVDALTATDATYTNIDVALVAKGTGATLAQVPDATATGGDKRGTKATDWQKIRNNASEVASGISATISGGENNTASGVRAAIGGGEGNVASGIRGVVGGGTLNTASGQDSTISGGRSNTVSAQESTVSGGRNNTASSQYSSVGGGQSNIAQTSTHATVCGGSSNTASGQYACVGGGQSNTTSSSHSFVGGGQSNTASANTHATVCGGSTNTASGQYSFVGGGYTNTASGSNSFIGNGDTNTASGLASVIGGGFFNQATGEGAVIAGGNRNVASGLYSFIGGGYRGSTRGLRGYHVFPACVVPIADVAGVSQSGLLVLGRQTTDATTTVLASNSSAASTTNQVILPNNSAYSFSGEVIANVTGAGNSARWTIDGAIKRGANAASTVMIGTPTVVMSHFDAGAATWVVALTADTTNGGITVTVTGAAATTIRWVCRIDTTEMTY